MQYLRAATRRILKRVEEKTGKNIEFMRDENLSLLAALNVARNGAAYHVLRYRPSNDPLDYVIAFQAGFILRLFENEPSQRFDFAPSLNAGHYVEQIITGGQILDPADAGALPEFAKFVAQWALINLRSLPIGMRIDHWIASEYPELKELQLKSIRIQQQQNVNLISYKLGKLTIPAPLMGTVAAYALFADRLTDNGTFAIPYEAAGLLEQGHELLKILDQLPSNAQSDYKLVDSWADKTGMSDWYTWIPYRT